MSWFYLKGVSNFLIRYELSIIGELDKWGSQLLHRWIKALIIKSYQPYYDFHSKISINDTRDLLKELTKPKKTERRLVVEDLLILIINIHQFRVIIRV